MPVRMLVGRGMFLTKRRCALSRNDAASRRVCGRAVVQQKQCGILGNPLLGPDRLAVKRVRGVEACRRPRWCCNEPKLALRPYKPFGFSRGMIWCDGVGRWQYSLHAQLHVREHCHVNPVLASISAEKPWNPCTTDEGRACKLTK